MNRRIGEWRAEAETLRIQRPRNILFLCVANSARSQIAEGIARSLAPPGVKVSSAGSFPASVRPQAIRVLEEIGIDISGHRSKGMESIDAGSVDAVITLCAEEVCPVFPGKPVRIHWGLPDPAAVTGTEEARLNAFRSVRDELLIRLKVLFGHGEETAVKRPRAIAIVGNSGAGKTTLLEGLIPALKRKGLRVGAVK
ncbi:MAG: protein tyrosine phosphatase, partial [Deltaproteobacteria bacterium]|nr:protein tyrosine phosphatase [Deltaproteobacteria bacterium]